MQTDGNRMEGLMRGRLDLSKIAKNFKRESDKHGHRLDMTLHASADTYGGKRKKVRIGFNNQLGNPSDQDVEGFARAHFPGFVPFWKSASFGQSFLDIELRAYEERIPVAGIKELPEGFERVATATYRRIEADGKTFSVWRLEKDAEGLSLIREKNENAPVAAPKVQGGQWVNTPDGPGQVVSASGNSVRVKFRDETQREYPLRTVATLSTEEQKKLFDYYSQAFGDPEFAKKLVYGAEEKVNI